MNDDQCVFYRATIYIMMLSFAVQVRRMVRIGEGLGPNNRCQFLSVHFLKVSGR